MIHHPRVDTCSLNTPRDKSVNCRMGHAQNHLPYRTLEPPSPVLLLVAPRLELPSPRLSSYPDDGARLAPKNDESPGLVGAATRSRSQSYAAPAAAGCRFVAEFQNWFARPPATAPVQNPGLQFPQPLEPWLGFLE
jgi:hypothetical protein